MKVILGLLFMLGAASLAQARLGETPDQITARFGNGESLDGSPVGDPSHGNYALAGIKQQRFQKQAFEIKVLLTDISIGETYIAESTLTQNQIESLLSAESENHQWKEEAPWNGNRYWIRDDGARAQLDPNNQFVFKSKFLIDKEKSWKDAWTQAHTPSTEGF